MMNMKEIYAMRINKGINEALGKEFVHKAMTAEKLAKGIELRTLQARIGDEEIVVARIAVEPKHDEEAVAIIFEILSEREDRRPSLYGVWSERDDEEEEEETIADRICYWSETHHHGDEPVDFLHS